MGWPTNSNRLNVSDLYFAVEGLGVEQQKTVAYAAQASALFSSLFHSQEQTDRPSSPLRGNMW